MNDSDSFYYICSAANLQSILRHGIFSRSAIIERGIEHKDIHDPGVLARRQKPINENRSLHDYVNLYFQPRNAMLYRLVSNFDREDLIILQISREVLNIPGALVSNRNAAALNARFAPANTYRKHVDFSIFAYQYWTDSDDTKQKMMAEVLIPERIAADKIIGIYTHSTGMIPNIRKMAGSISVVQQPSIFFLPAWRKKLSGNIHLSKGDMFFSSMQTFTISVNTVGVMGKGLASRTKYQFPDAYVRYQDDCKSKKLKPGKPTLYKRAIRIEEQLADDASQLNPQRLNGERWFLFFPTKRNWRDDSRIDDIEKSLQWLCDNYEHEGIQSIALPALGCGLGNLHWKDIGPLMCSYLSKMTIPSVIYLPMEEAPDERFLSPDYLLRGETK